MGNHVEVGSSERSWSWNATGGVDDQESVTCVALGSVAAVTETVSSFGAGCAATLGAAGASFGVV